MVLGAGVITVDFVYDVRYWDRFETFFRIKNQLRDLGVAVLDNEKDRRSDIAVVQSHLVDQLRADRDLRVFRPVIINERADQETVAVGHRQLLKEPNTLGWLKECTIRDPKLHNAPHVEGYYHYTFMSRDGQQFPAYEPAIKLDDSDIAKIRVPFSVASYSRFTNFRMRPILDIKERGVDLFAWGTVNSTHELYQMHRARASQAVAAVGAANPNYNTVLAVGKGLSQTEMLDLLFRSKIVVSQYGHSMSSYKDWEALYAGCVLIRPDASQQVNYLPDLFKGNKWYVPCAPDYSDLEDKIEMVLQDYPKYLKHAQIARSALMESVDDERLASDFYHMICGIVGESPRQSAAKYAAIDPDTYREAKPVNLLGSESHVKGQTAGQPGIGIVSGDFTARPLRGPNLLGSHGELESGPWATVRSRIDTEPVIGPAAIVARKLVEDTSTDTHDFRRAIAKDATPLNYVFSFVAKAGERSRVQVWMGDATCVNRAQVSFDLVAGRVVDSKSHGNGWLNPRAGSTCLAGGWCWCWVTVLSDASSSLTMLVGLEAPDGNIGYEGDGKSGAYFGNMRLEDGEVATLVLPMPERTSALPVIASRGRPTEDAEKVALELGDYYDRYFSKARAREIAGFHGDYFLMRYMFNLLQQADLFVETGSLSGDTTACVARNFVNMPCYTCELDPRNFEITRNRTRPYANIEASNEPSPDFLYALYSRTPRLAKSPVVFWLDAHAKGALPLPAEVEKITGSSDRFCIAIDDFQVPGRPDFAFDSYPPIVLNWDLIRGCLRPGRKYKVVYPKYEAHTSLHTHRVGWIVIAFGDWELVPKGLEDLYEISEYSA